MRINGCFKGGLRVFQRWLKGDSRKSQGLFEKDQILLVSLEFVVHCFKKVSRVFQGGFKSVSRKFKGGFKDVPRKF